MSTEFREQLKQVKIQTSAGEVTIELEDEVIDTIVKLHEAEVERIIGENIPTFGPQNEAGDISIEDYQAAAVNQRLDEQRQRAAITPKEDK